MDLTKKHCVPCEGGIAPFTDEEVTKYALLVPSWEVLKAPQPGTAHILAGQYKFEDFKKAIAFVNRVAELAESEGHHPNIKINYSKVTLELFTHAIGGLSENDFILAAKIDAIG